MLPDHLRLHNSGSFRRAVRGGRRGASRLLVVHVQLAGPSVGGPATEPTRAGLVVSKAVGNAVVRNRVKRQLRHLLRPALDTMPAGGLVVVRALPAAADATSAELRLDLDRCLSRAIRTSQPGDGRGSSVMRTSS